MGAAISAITAAGAATGGSASHGAATHRARATHAGARRGALRRLLRAVQGSAVVRTADGFATVSFERGKVVSVSGQQLTLTEGTPKATYKTVTVTVPTNAVVRDNRQTASLSDVKAGQRAIVLTAPKHTYVIAHTPKTG